ncbi:hypothetical protein B6S12_03560 [Helicobacter valdiviensis]|uniref:FxsA protein n=1 Tax=Helicobacter valdiviensis TaxID=1458358 RepID=A0A2W6NMA2_9HELI|nr:FxsA family protein [Helicobacter valdiviensis]PZT48556.1 hypothetical protein B6S12_03560 [Helicobacter valdiviensis]
MPLILLLVYIFIEVLVSYEIIEIIGVFGFFLEIVLSAFLGFFILMNFRVFFGEALGKLRSREISHEAFVGSNIFRILGAILLILPGGFTDILGILMQFSSLGFIMVKPFVKHKNTHNNSTHQEIIDVEVITKDKSE